MSEDEKKLYIEIGLLSTNFATIEHQVQGMLARYITKGDQDNMIVGIVLDSDSLEQKLQHLEKAILFELHHIELLKKYIKEVRKFKVLRNSFIHGSWNVVPVVKGPKLSVYHNKVLKVLGKHSSRDKDNPGWQMGNVTLYSQTELMSINVSVKKLRNTGDDIIQKMDNGAFEYL